MKDEDKNETARIKRELAYYRREYNDLGARILGLQEEQSRAFREARRSRTVAKLMREAYRLVDSVETNEEFGKIMAEIVIENALCDRVAILRRVDETAKFVVVHALGFASDPVPVTVRVANAPEFFFTTAESVLEPPAYELTEVLRVPYILWSFDPGSGYAMIIGNHSERNVSRPFEKGDHELIEGALSVYIDVTLRKHSEVELRSAKQEAETAHNLQRNFLATFSHELRTPLNAIIGFSDMLGVSKVTPTSSKKFQEYSKDINNSANYLLSLIDDILDFGKSGVDPVEIEPSETNLMELVSVVIHGMKPIAERRTIRFSIDVNDRIPAILVDPRRIRQVVTNLVGNAVKFSPDGSVIRITLGRSAEDNGVTIEVADEGIGIPEEDLANVLKPFFQSKGGYNGTSQGVGLGLSICEALVAAHGGQISITSVLGEGTVVTVVLPESRVIDGERFD